MLVFYRRLALWLQQHRIVLWLLCAGAVTAALAAAFMVPGAAGSRYVFGAIVLLMWAIGLLTVGAVFAAPLPHAEPGARWMARLRVRCRRAILTLMAVVMSGLSLLLIFVTLRALGNWWRGG